MGKVQIFHRALPSINGLLTTPNLKDVGRIEISLLPTFVRNPLYFKEVVSELAGAVTYGYHKVYL